MGVDYITYIGPYLECHYINKDNVKKIHCCMNPLCHKYLTIFDSTNVYCSMCGKMLSVDDHPTDDPNADILEIEVQLQDSICRPLGDEIFDWQNKHHMHIWLINRVLQCVEYPLIILDNECNYVQEIPAEMPMAQMDAFRSQFAKEIETLEGFYGHENMKYKWGIIQQVC